MCLLAIQFRTYADTPLIVAANREEYFDRPSLPPTIQPGSPRVACGIDARAQGTWLGVNEFGVIVGVTNRLTSHFPAQPRSRGLLCLELLRCRSAGEAAQLAERELESGHYAGANYLCADLRDALVVQYAEDVQVTPLPPGLHLLTNSALDERSDDRQLFARYLFAAKFPNSRASFLTRAAEILRQTPEENHGYSIVLRGEDRGTVSSSLIALTKDPHEAVYQHADGSPDRTEYLDYSPLLRDLLTSAEKPANVAMR